MGVVGLSWVATMGRGTEKVENHCFKSLTVMFLTQLWGTTQNQPCKCFLFDGRFC